MTWIEVDSIPYKSEVDLVAHPFYAVLPTNKKDHFSYSYEPKDGAIFINSAAALKTLIKKYISPDCKYPEHVLKNVRHLQAFLNGMVDDLKA